MAESSTTSSSPMGQAQTQIQHYLESKRYQDEPEVLPWYTKEVVEMKPKARNLFESYSKIPADEVTSHVKKVRDEAFRVYPYPCLGNWGFLNLSISDNPSYDEVLQRLKNGEAYLDLGCCMGQDMRVLVHDGAPSENLTGADLKKEFWNISFDMFLDKDTLKAKFIEADVFDADSGLKDLDEKIDIVHTASFFHLFDRERQLKAAKRVVQLLKAKPGVMILGRQGGMPVAGDFRHINPENTSYWHSPESWAEFWKEVGDETGSKWDVQASLGEEDLSKRMKTTLVPAGTRFLTFVIRRV